MEKIYVCVCKGYLKQVKGEFAGLSRVGTKGWRSLGGGGTTHALVLEHVKVMPWYRNILKVRP